MWTPAYLKHFDSVYIFDDVRSDLSTHEFGNMELSVCIRTSQKCNQGASKIWDGNFGENSCSDLKVVTIKGCHLRCLSVSRICLCWWIQHSYYYSNGDTFLTTGKDFNQLSLFEI